MSRRAAFLQCGPHLCQGVEVLVRVARGDGDEACAGEDGEGLDVRKAEACRHVVTEDEEAVGAHIVYCVCNVLLYRGGDDYFLFHCLCRVMLLLWVSGAASVVALENLSAKILLFPETAKKYLEKENVIRVTGSKTAALPNGMPP